MYNRLLSAGTSETSRSNRQSSLDRGDASNYIDSTTFRRSIDQNMHIHAEHRVTITVCAIVTCFTLTQGPSAIVLFMDFLWGNRPPFVNSNVVWYHANILAGFLVVIGKTLNFVLFCLSSATFRRRLLTILSQKARYVFTRKSSLIANSSAMIPNPKYAASNADRRFSLF
uniref:G-protein coupled receptors family 1 profile domain-containing protein n=1 Tax=Acrobeloides nanus TaxID=290746 RepID=A0A914D380_9BILA